MANHNEIGKKGEEIAKKYLLDKGYKVLACNYRFKHLEIDIICEKDCHLIIVEVKTRQSSYLAGPEDTVSKTKQKGIIKCANAYIIEHEIDMETRFDIIAIILNTNEKSIVHIEDAFYPLR
ncbi:endonuclease [Putridiphycobacter roseus]|uniref:UPF0102 protein DNU06_03615 n=1 Tax=Putridiphycobacter roseus TaxID=2219161 RepID=A0A2W1NVT4_9FLAO|nr:YraN family protein [Putridiphycobacter roseus]PZE18928.1 endonuclease [Putridiphycobacter roseus]